MAGNLFRGSSAGGGIAPAADTINFGALPGFASGTDRAPGGLAIVGERGPELVTLPRGSSVTPNDKLGSMGAVSVRGGDVNITVQGNADEKTLAVLKREL